MARLFISHAGENTAEAVAICDWLNKNGWDDVFFDRAREKGINPGERWERALYAAAYRCEAVIFLVSRPWLASPWCRKEFFLARGLGRRLFPVLIEAIRIEDLEPELTETWQFADLSSGEDHEILRVKLPVTQKDCHVHFSKSGLDHLRNGLANAGLDPRFFAWPPVNEPDRPPYRGLSPLEPDDAGIFFGRDAQIIEALARLDGLRKAAPPRMLVILGASGAGKSSFLRAGLIPRLSRDDRRFLPLSVVRPEKAIISGNSGLVVALERAFREAQIPTSQPELHEAIQRDQKKLRTLLRSLVSKRTPPTLDHEVELRSPTLIISIDQAEELFVPDGRREAETFLALLADLLKEGRSEEDQAQQEAPQSNVLELIALFTIRSDSYEQLQSAQELKGVHQETLALPPMLKGSYSEVIKGPARRLEQAARELATTGIRGARSPRPLKIDDKLVERLLFDIQMGGAKEAGGDAAQTGDAKDALPLLAFTLERLYFAFRGRGYGEPSGLVLTVRDYEQLGGIHGAINATVSNALEAADKDTRVPKDKEARETLLRHAFIPNLARIDPETKSARRLVARRSDIPKEALPLIEHLIDQRLLVTDLAGETGEQTIEPAHEALLRQWSKLRDWLAEDAELLISIDGVKRAAKDWEGHAEDPAWLAHSGGRLRAIELLVRERPDLATSFKVAEGKYLAACRRHAQRSQQMRGVMALLFAGIVFMGVGWVYKSEVLHFLTWVTRTLPYMLTEVRPLTPEAERALRPGDTFKECVRECPRMVVVPAGEFQMGSPINENGRYEGRDHEEGPIHRVTIARPFAVSENDVTFDEWNACVNTGGCAPIDDQGGGLSNFGHGRRPVIYVTWSDAKKYVVWLSAMTGKEYRLLSEAEWEYAARAQAAIPVSGKYPRYSFGDSEAVLGDYAWYAANSGTTSHPFGETHPVHEKLPNAFGLFDMHGNVFQWVEDCKHESYRGHPPSDGSPWLSEGDCSYRMYRGGDWNVGPAFLRSAYRDYSGVHYSSDKLGFRVARTLVQ